MSDLPTLRTVTIGPRSRRIGRSYGLRTNLPNLAMRQHEVIQGFAEALSSWSQTSLAEAEPRFSLLLGLPGGEGFLLLKCRFLGLGSQGTVAVAQGVFLSGDDMTALDNRAHLALGAIPEPAREPWEDEFVTLAFTTPAAPINPAPITNMTHIIRHADQTLNVATDAFSQGDAALIDILESLNLGSLAERVTWTGNSHLRASLGFDPASFRIVFHPIGQMPASVSAVEIENGVARFVGERDAWDVLFNPSPAEEGMAQCLREAEKPSFPKLFAAIARTKWKGEYQNAARDAVFADAFAGLTAHADDLDEICDLFEILATRLRAVPPSKQSDAVAASRGLTMLFEAMKDSRDQMTRFLEQWIARIHHHLVGVDYQPLGYAFSTGLVSDIGEKSFLAALGEEPTERASALVGNWLDDTDKVGRVAYGRIFPILLERLPGQLSAQPANLHAMLGKMAKHTARFDDATQEENLLEVDIFSSRHRVSESLKQLPELFESGRDLSRALRKHSAIPAVSQHVDTLADDLLGSVRKRGMSSLFKSEPEWADARILALLPLATIDQEISLG